MNLRTALLSLLLAALPLTSQAWWNKDWTQRSLITLDTSAAGTNTTEALVSVPLALRLHGGNFDFIAASEDGGDLRVLAADDKTPLPFRIERFDPVNELAVLWVLVPAIAPGSDKNTVHVYSGNAKAVAETGTGTATGMDSATRAAFHFTAADGSDASGALKPATPPVLVNDGLLGGALKLGGSAVVWPMAEALRTPADGSLSVSMWLKADAVAGGTLWRQGPASLALQAGKLQARVGSAQLTGGEVKPGAWTHLALTLGAGKAVLYVDGVAVGQADVPTPAIEGEMRLGEGLTGALDELQLAATVRPAAWLALASATQGIGGKGLKGQMEAEGAADGGGGGGGHFSILVDNLTIDAWVVIVILMVMFVIATWVMVAKSVEVSRADKDNQNFLGRFRAASKDLLTLDQGATHPYSPLYRLYRAGQRELAKRKVGESGEGAVRGLSGVSMNAVKAAVDADLVRESHSLNSGMVLLTIAISGGPFLGLLGTVVGVMITFAAIAAAGDVNVNAIAPGIAAALLATVAGLAVAIPALFGYNYLASRIKNVSADMQIFVDEFITRVAEEYGS